MDEEFCSQHVEYLKFVHLRKLKEWWLYLVAIGTVMAVTDTYFFSLLKSLKLDIYQFTYLGNL